MRKADNNTATTNTMTKREALANLGVNDLGARKRIDPMTDLAHVAEGRRIVRKGENFRTVIAGVSGSILVTTASGAAVEIAAPFVIDTWSADERALATIDVVTATPCDLILLNVEHRDAGFTEAGDFAKHSYDTVQNLFQAMGSGEQAEVNSAMAGALVG